MTDYQQGTIIWSHVMIISHAGEQVFFFFSFWTPEQVHKGIPKKKKKHI